MNFIEMTGKLLVILLMCQCYVKDNLNYQYNSNKLKHLDPKLKKIYFFLHNNLLEAKGNKLLSRQDF